ncbi:unnamed protein product, partial [Meganyctiphanes norvegica]
TIILVGVDTGAVFQCDIGITTHGLIRYPAHVSAVRGITWNPFHEKVFATCSVDWTLKIWVQKNLTPMIILELGRSVAGVTWAPYSSTIIVAASDEGRVHVYDLVK